MGIGREMNSTLFVYKPDDRKMGAGHSWTNSSLPKQKADDQIGIAPRTKLTLHRYYMCLEWTLYFPLIHIGDFLTFFLLLTVYSKPRGSMGAAIGVGAGTKHCFSIFNCDKIQFFNQNTQSIQLFCLKLIFLYYKMQ